MYAHQSPRSFNAAVRDAAMEELKEQGYRVVVSDLYAMNFRANATQDDIIGDLTVDDCVDQRSKYVFGVKS